MKTTNAPLPIADDPPTFRLALPLLAAFKKVWQVTIRFLSSGNELRIWTTTDREGNTLWHGYDPSSDRSTCLGSEAEMRGWIEQRYYH